MNKKTRKLFTWCVVVAMLITQMLFTNVAFAATKKAGADRYQTALEIVKAGWTKSDAAVIARGDDLADALAAAPLAYAKGKAPILLTETNALPAGVLDELKALGVKTVYIVGGPGAVSTGVEDALKVSFTVDRVFGADRVATSLAAAKKAFTTDPTEVVLVNAYAYADALSISSVAATKGAPVLLVDGTLSPEVANYVAGKKVYAVGGNGVLSDAVVAAAKADRVAGLDRYATNAAILAKFTFDYSKVYAAKGTDDNMVDALAGSALAALTGAPIVLVDENNSIAPATDALKAGLLSNSEVYLLGGTVPDSVGAAIEALRPAAAAPVVKSAKVVNYKTIEVTLDKAVKSVKAEDFTISPALAVKAAVLSADGLVVTLTTDPQEEGTTYAVKAAGQTSDGAVFVGAKAPNGAISIVSAEARTNSEVTVVLADAPLVELTASDFVITPYLNIVSVTTDDNVVTLKTSAQTAGTVYTVATVAGSGSAQFTGLADIDTTGIIKSVDVPNLRQLVINLTKPVVWADAQDLNNFYLGLTENEDANITLRSIATLGADNDWIVSAGSQKVLDADGDPIKGVTVNYLVLEATDGALLTDLGLKYNENATVEVRNIVDANGYIHTSQGAFTLVDNKAPTADSTAVINVEPDDTTAPLEVSFDEPVVPMADNAQFRVYIDGVEVTATTEVEGVTVLAADVDATTTVAAHEVLTLDVFGYERDVEHTLKVVGAKDLHNNVMSPNPYTAKFTIKDTAADAPTPPARVKVVDVKQVADNIVEIYFDHADVVKYDDAAKSLTFKKAAWDGTQWIDMVDGTALTIDDTQTYTDKDGNDLSKWVVTFDADLARNADVFSYDGQKLVSRTIEIKNYIASDALDITGEAYYAGATYTKLFTFQHDTTAPVLANAKTYDVDGMTLYVSFKDAPFDGIIQLGDVPSLKVSLTNSKGQSFTANVDIANVAVGAGEEVNDIDFAAGKYVAIDLSGYPALLNADEDGLVRGAVYTVAFPKASILDADRDGEEKVEISASEDADAPYATFHAIAATAVSIAVPKAAAATTDEGLVPQTTKGMLFSGTDYTDGYDQLVVDGDDAVGNAEYLAADENANKIFIFFDGQVLESSALYKGNYTFNGKPLSANATVAYYKGDLVGAGDTGIVGNQDENGDQLDGMNVGYVVITLPANSVEKSGLYTVSVSGITNEEGKRMLPVADSVALVDNTAPVAQTLKVVGSRQLQLTFDEQLQFDPSDAAAADKACNNFTVVVNGFKYTVDAVTLSADVKSVILTLSQDFDVNGSLDNVKATVTTVKDADGNMWITDTAAVPNDIRDKVKLNN